MCKAQFLYNTKRLLIQLVSEVLGKKCQGKPSADQKRQPKGKWFKEKTKSKQQYDSSKLFQINTTKSKLETQIPKANPNVPNSANSWSWDLNKNL